MPYDLKYGQVTLENQRNIADDEPVIVFRAQDRLLPKLLKVYRYFCELAANSDPTRPWAGACSTVPSSAQTETSDAIDLSVPAPASEER